MRVESPPKEPDTGAGVLRFLTDDREAPVADSALSPAPDAATTPESNRSNGGSSPPPGTPPPSTAPTPWHTPADDDRLTPPRPDRPAPTENGTEEGIKTEEGNETGTGAGVVRILAVLREPRPGAQNASAEEPDAMMGLELVVAELSDPQSTLQRTLRNSLDDRAKRIWCPEAEGPNKGPHRCSGMRARHTPPLTAVARLRHAKRMG